MRATTPTPNTAKRRFEERPPLNSSAVASDQVSIGDGGPNGLSQLGRSFIALKNGPTESSSASATGEKIAPHESDKMKADVQYCESKGLHGKHATFLAKVAGEKEIEKVFGDFGSLLVHENLEDTDSRERWDAISFLGEAYSQKDSEWAEKMLKDKVERVSFQRKELAGFKGVLTDQLSQLSGSKKEAFEKYMAEEQGSDEQWFWINRRGETEIALDVLSSDLDFQKTWTFGIGDPDTAQNKRFGDSRKERWNLFKELETEYGEDFAQKRMSSFNSAHLNVFEMRTCISLPHLSPSVIRDSNTDKNEKERASHAGPDFFKFRVSEPF